MEGVEASGSTVDEAVENALDELGLEREDVEVEVLDERDGQARVRVTPLEELDDEDDEDDEDEDADDMDDEGEDDADEGDADEGEDDAGEDDADADTPDAAPAAAAERAASDADDALADEDLDEAEYAAQMLDKLLAMMNVEADVSIRDPETPGDGLGMANAVLDIEGDDLGILIGRRGETLGSLQYLLNLMVAQKLGRQEFFTVDVEGYRRRRENSLTSLARRMADQVKRTGRPVTLEPMPANERRIIHLTLSESRFVSTESIGEGEDRQVAIQPKRGRE